MSRVPFAVTSEGIAAAVYLGVVRHCRRSLPLLNILRVVARPYCGERPISPACLSALPRPR